MSVLVVFGVFFFVTVQAVVLGKEEEEEKITLHDPTVFPELL